MPGQGIGQTGAHLECFLSGPVQEEIKHHHRKALKANLAWSIDLMGSAAKAQMKAVQNPTTTKAPTGLQQRKCNRCYEKKKILQRSAVSSAPATVPPIVHEVLRSPGASLDPRTRAFMEPRFGYDFSGVHIFTEAGAAESARSVNALAYTVGSNVVFGSGAFQPNTSAGRQLLAHELTHVIQQRSGTVQLAEDLKVIDSDAGLEAEANAAGLAINNNAKSNASLISVSGLQRQPKGSGSKAPNQPQITEVLVNQDTPQQVTATFSDGHTVSDECSTGKGHCCFDETAGAAAGGACSAARSRQTNNNCTPVGDDFIVTAKIPVTGGGIRFWTQFHDAKQVALHEYNPVDGTPLSHGCVRLHTKMAQTIFDGSVKGLTRVKVRGLSKPRCENKVLQNEWIGDFTTAGSKPPDGQTIDPYSGRRLKKEEIEREKHNILETRKEMRSALGVDEAGLDSELAAVAGGTAIISKIPRCVPALTTEEQKVSSAQSSGFLTSSASATAAAFTSALRRTRSEASAEGVVKQFGEKLWQNATASARSGGTGTDDRQVYWMRLMLTTALRQWDPSFVPNADSLRRLHARLLSLLERTSRGLTTSAFPTNLPDVKRILISGFDPFGFPNPGGDIRQSNLSGAAAMALDGVTLTQGSTSAEVEGVVFPVRYADFNEGIVESHLRPHLTGQQPPHLVMSISQGGGQFEFEEWAGRRRSTGNYLENQGLLSGGTQTSPIEPPGFAAGPEFLRHNVPPTMLGAMRGAVNRTSATTAETNIVDLPSGAKQPRQLPGGPGKSPGLAVEGSGGGFLSNEIFYRNSLLRTQTGSNVPLIHLHTPMLAPDASDKMRNILIDKIREILRATILHL